MAINITISHDPINAPATKTATINNIAAKTSKNWLGVITTPDSKYRLSNGTINCKGGGSHIKNIY